MKKMITRRSFLQTLCGTAAVGAMSVCSSPAASAAFGETAVAGRQIAYLEPFDWGPGVTRTILALDKYVWPQSVNAASFSVKETKPSFDFMTGQVSTLTCNRPVVAAYCCDQNGDRTQLPSNCIALEMECTPQQGYPIYADSWQGRFGEDYQLKVTLTDASTLRTVLGLPITALDVDTTFDWDEAIIPVLKKANLNGHFTASDGRTYRYASFEPTENGEKHPLVVWLHGAGEGGTDVRLPLLGNKATALYSDKFQNLMGGAYVLAPQCPDFWLTYNENGDWQGNPGKDSVHLKAIEELIRTYAQEHSGVDMDRIYLTGCSNGGFMTMDLILNYPDQYAAAVPCCEAFLDEAITDEQINAIKNLPIWFVFASSDPLVVPELYELPTMERLHAAQATNVHASVFDKIVDRSGKYVNADGSPYDYGGHSCWVHFFNDDCVDEAGLNCWKWLAQQSR